MSAVVLPAAIADFTSTQVIFSNSTRSVCARGAARADPAVSIREAVPPAINISKECETEPTRMSFSLPQKHKLVAVLTENLQCHKFISITIILPVPHDSEICPDGGNCRITGVENQDPALDSQKGPAFKIHFRARYSASASSQIC